MQRLGQYFKVIDEKRVRIVRANHKTFKITT